MKDVKVGKIFDEAFVSVSKKLVSLELHKREKTKINYKYLEIVHTKGKFVSTVICGFSPVMFDTIIKNMNGGKIPSEEEKILYLNEYVNIVCGRALSEINNQLGVSSKLTVPMVCVGTESISVDSKETDNIVLFYETEYGEIEVLIYYTVIQI